MSRSQSIAVRKAHARDARPTAPRATRRAETQIAWDATPRAVWERAAADAPLQQAWAYGEAMRALGAGVARAEARLRGRRVALAQAICRRWSNWLTTAVLMRGPIWTAPLTDAERAAVLRGLVDAAPFSRPRVMLASPEAEPGAAWVAAAGLRRAMTGYATATLALDRSDDALLAAMRGKWRNRLKAALRSGLDARVRRWDVARLDALLAAEDAQRRQRRYAGLPPAFTPAYAAAAGPDAVRIFGVDGPEGPEAAMLFLAHGRGATYHIGWASPAAKASGGHNAVLWRAMRALRDAGVSRLDMGGLDTDSAAGVARFKLGAGAEPTQLCGSFL